MFSLSLNCEKVLETNLKETILEVICLVLVVNKTVSINILIRDINSKDRSCRN